MIKINFILNAIVAVILLALILMLVLFGYRYYKTTSVEASPAYDKVSQVEGIRESVLTNVDLDEIAKTANVNAQSVDAQSEPAPTPAPPKRPLISLYPGDNDSDSNIAFTTMEKNNEIVVFEAGSEWTEIFSSKGLPVWIRGDMVKEVRKGYVEVSVNSSRVRSLPDTQTGEIIGKVNKGEYLRVSRKKDNWLRVWSPMRLKAWVKTEELEQ